MVKFTEITDKTKTMLPTAPWELKNDYKRIVTVQGHSYELIKYMRDPNLFQRLTCALSAAWLWLKSCGKDQKKITNQWDKATGRKQIGLHYGTLKASGSNLKNKAKTDLKDTPKEQQNRIELSTYQDSLKAIEKGDFKNAAGILFGLAQRGDQQAFDLLRKLAEENHTDWDNYNTALILDYAYKLVKTRFSEKQRETIKSAIAKADGGALHQLGCECIGNKQYPEAYLCLCESLRVGNAQALDTIKELKKSYLMPKVQEEMYLNEFREFKQMEEDNAIHWRQIADGYERLYFREDYIPMDKEIKKWREAWLAQQAIRCYKEAIKQGDSASGPHFLQNITHFQWDGNLPSEEFESVRDELYTLLEALAKKNNAIDLWIFLIGQYGHTMSKIDFEKTSAWLKEVARDPAFEPNAKDIQDGKINPKQIRACAEAAKLGDLMGMKIINAHAEVLPKNFLQETREALAKALEPTIKSHLKQADNKNFIRLDYQAQVIRTLKDIYETLKDEEQAKKWDTRLKEFGQTFSKRK